ncbi:MAG: ankyrin repeat domain-containing protein [Acidobacteriota bacterium]
MKIFEAIDRNDIPQVWALVRGRHNLQVVDAETGLTPLALAAEMGHGEIVRILLEADVDPDLGGATTPLEAAVLEGDLEIVQSLLEAGADVNRAVSGGSTPLMSAAATGDEEIAWRLIERGARIRARNSEDQTAIDIATNEGFLDLARDMRKFNRKEYDEELAERDAAEAERDAERLRQREARLTEMKARQERAERERLERQQAALRATAEAEAALRAAPLAAPAGTEPFLQPPADAPSEPADTWSDAFTDGDSQAPLVESSAAEATHDEEAIEPEEMAPEATVDPGLQRFEDLLQEGDDVGARIMVLEKEVALDARGADGRTPLMLAAAAGAPETVRALLDRGAEVDAVDATETGDTALLRAIHHETPRQLAVVRQLIEAGTDLEQGHGAQGLTPLMYAATADVYREEPGLRFADLTKLIIEAGADLEATDARGNTVWRLIKRNALGAATSSPYRRRLFQMLKVLESAGAQQIASHAV